jgi:hypothetical protein
MSNVQPNKHFWGYLESTEHNVWSHGLTIICCGRAMWRSFLSIAKTSCHSVWSRQATSTRRSFEAYMSASMAKLVRHRDFQNLVGSISAPSRCRVPRDTRCFSVLNRPPPNYEGHIPLTVAERLGLAFGSGLGSFLDPRRGGKRLLAIK